MNKYNPSEIEPKWQKKWEEAGVFHASNTSDKPKYYALIEFPYPSGQGLHVGHPRPYTALDVVSRKRRMEGYNVLYPIGWDAFGLPAENYAIKNHVHPEEITKKNIARFKQQIQSLQSCSRSHEISMVKSEHYRISALGIENIGKVFFHTPIQAVSTFYIKSFLICKRNSYMVVFCYFESVFICHFCCPLFLLIIRHLPAGGRPASHQRKAEQITPACAIAVSVCG